MPAQHPRCEHELEEIRRLWRRRRRWGDRGSPRPGRTRDLPDRSGRAPEPTPGDWPPPRRPPARAPSTPPTPRPERATRAHEGPAPPRAPGPPPPPPPPPPPLTPL